MASQESPHAASSPSDTLITAAANAPSAPTPTSTSHLIQPEQIQTQKDELPSSTPVEMSQLETHSHNSSSPPAAATAPTPATTSTNTNPPSTEPTTASARDPSHPSPQPTGPTAPTLTRAETNPIGPPSEDITTQTPTTATASADPFTLLIALLLTTGARHPYKLSPAYLAKRGVAATDPADISVYTLKELIWRDWREDWEARPASVGSIRLISFGKLLEDRSLLRDCRFTNTGANVVHMTIRPASTDGDEDGGAKGKMSRSGRGTDEDCGAGGCCRCCTLM